MRRLLGAAVAGLLLAAVPIPALADGPVLPEYSGVEFQELYEYAVSNTLPNLDPPNGEYSITGNKDTDSRIYELAYGRGYVLRPAASGDLGSADGVRMQPQAADAWRGLKSDARAAGMRFVVSSAYRSPAAQRTQFLSKLNGTSDNAIEAALTWYSIPGTSKHHGGYALDFRYRDGTFSNFRSTLDYEWLKEDNFAIPKSYGLVPSYPDDGDNQGPNPEPWEFVWVGANLVHCGLPQAVEPMAGPAAALVGDLGRCPGGPAKVSVPDWLVTG